jgi:hypothetical protein
MKEVWTVLTPAGFDFYFQDNRNQIYRSRMRPSVQSEIHEWDRVQTPVEIPDSLISESGSWTVEWERSPENYFRIRELSNQLQIQYQPSGSSKVLKGEIRPPFSVGGTEFKLQISVTSSGRIAVFHAPWHESLTPAYAEKVDVFTGQLEIKPDKSLGLKDGWHRISTKGLNRPMGLVRSGEEFLIVELLPSHLKLTSVDSLRSEAREAEVVLDALEGKEVPERDLQKAAGWVVEGRAAGIGGILYKLAESRSESRAMSKEKADELKNERLRLAEKFSTDFGDLQQSLGVGILLGDQRGKEESLTARIAQWLQTLGSIDSLAVSGTGIDRKPLEHAVKHFRLMDFSSKPLSDEFLALADMDETNLKKKIDEAYFVIGIDPAQIEELRGNPLLRDHIYYLGLFMALTLSALKIKNPSLGQDREALRAALLRFMGPVVYGKILIGTPQGLAINAAEVLTADYRARSEIRRAA